MKTLIGIYKSDDGKDYYDFGLNIITGEVIRIKNTSCSADAEKIAFEYFKTKNNQFTKFDIKSLKIFFNGINPEIDLNRIPKKYQKFFIGEIK